MTWGLSNNALNAVLNQSTDFFFPICEVPIEAEGQIITLRCPCCGENLMISHDIYRALISGEERTRISNAVRSINRHCSTHHEDVPLWIGVESAYLLEDTVSVVFLSQKLMCKASMKNPITNKDIQETISCARSRTLQSKIGLILSTAISDLQNQTRDRFGFSQEERTTFFNQVKELLNKLITILMSIDWHSVLYLEENEFLRLNFLKVLLRKGLLLKPEFPPFKALNLGAYHRSKISHHKRGEDVEGKFSILQGYQYLWKPNKDLVSTGASSYGEITRNGVEILIDSIRENLLILLSDEEMKHFRVLDIGGGLMTTMFHMAQKIEGFYCGIEYCPVRANLFAQSYMNLLENHQEDIKNIKIAYLMENLTSFSIFDFDLVYAFDEAFSTQDFTHMISVFLRSPRAKFFVIFKPLKNRSENRQVQRLLEISGLHLHSVLQLKMKGSFEISNAGLYIKQSYLRNPQESGEDLSEIAREWRGCASFWNAETAFESVKDLHESILEKFKQDKETRKKKRQKK
jgi:hypothetical protein